MKIADIKKFKLIREKLILTEWCRRGGEPIEVNVYLDEKSGSSYQVDERLSWYREANGSAGAKYGAWVKS